MSFTLKHLAYFVAAAEEGSVTGAARRLHVSQPSISAAIAQLEARFGLTLFVRHHAQGLSLTPAGRRLVVQARTLLAHAEELRLGAIGLGEGLKGELDVGCFLTFAPLIMPGLLRTFGARYPDIRIRLHEDHVQGVVDGLRAGRFECALTYDLGLGPDLEFSELAEVPLYALLADGHRLAKDPTVSLADLAAEPLILLGLPQSREYFLSIFYNQRLEPRIAHETPSFEMVRGLVANGYGCSIMHSRPASDLALDGRRLVYRPVREPVRATRLGLVRLRRARPTQMGEAFAAFCRERLGSRGAEPFSAGEIHETG
jgi:DNA-binding transcriptional LysR family regulator